MYAVEYVIETEATCVYLLCRHCPTSVRIKEMWYKTPHIT